MQQPKGCLTRGQRGAQQAKFKDLSSVPTTHKVEGENELLQVILRPPHAHYSIHTHTNMPCPTPTQINLYKK